MTEINKMYIDNLDHNGIMYWYNDAKEINDSLNNKK